MLKFKDSSGREWDLKLTLGIANRLRTDKVIDLLRIADNNMARYRSLMTDPADLAGVVWWIVKPQAEPLGIELDGFMSALDGDAIDAMIDKFQEALADFIPALRSLIRKGLQKGRELKIATDKLAMAEMERIDVEKMAASGLDRVKRELARLNSDGIDSSGNAVQEWESTLKAVKSPSRLES